MNDAPFTDGELLLWEVREKHQLVRRQVGFKRLDHGRAVVSWGLNYEGQPALFTADITELRRPVPPASPPKAERPVLPPPEPVALRREALRHAQRVWHEAEALARRADELVQLAKQGFVEAELELQRRFGDLEARAEAAALDRIRAGCTDPAPDIAAGEWGERETARRRRDTARAAFNRLEAEAAQAWVEERGADRGRREAAKFVLEGLAQVFVAALAEIEAKAAKHRAEVVALALLWPDESGPLRLGETADRIITSGPVGVVADPIGLRQQLVEHRQVPWQELFNRLLVDASADLEPD